METKVDLAKKPKYLMYFSKHWPKSLPRFLMSINSLVFFSFSSKVISLPLFCCNERFNFFVAFLAHTFRILVSRKVDPNQSQGKIHFSADKLNAFEKHEYTVCSVFQDDQGGLKIK